MGLVYKKGQDILLGKTSVISKNQHANQDDREKVITFFMHQSLKDPLYTANINPYLHGVDPSNLGHFAALALMQETISILVGTEKNYLMTDETFFEKNNKHIQYALGQKNHDKKVLDQCINYLSNPATVRTLFGNKLISIYRELSIGYKDCPHEWLAKTAKSIDDFKLKEDGDDFIVLDEKESPVAKASFADNGIELKPTEYVYGDYYIYPYIETKKTLLAGPERVIPQIQPQPAKLDKPLDTPLTINGIKNEDIGLDGIDVDNLHEKLYTSNPGQEDLALLDRATDECQSVGLSQTLVNTILSHIYTLKHLYLNRSLFIQRNPQHYIHFERGGPYNNGDIYPVDLVGIHFENCDKNLSIEKHLNNFHNAFMFTYEIARKRNNLRHYFYNAFSSACMDVRLEVLLTYLNHQLNNTDKPLQLQSLKKSEGKLTAYDKIAEHLTIKARNHMRGCTEGDFRDFINNDEDIISLQTLDGPFTWADVDDFIAYCKQNFYIF